MGHITRGWNLNAIIVARTPFPLDITSSHDVGFGNFALRPDLLLNVPLYLNNPNVPGGRQINIAAFSVPTNREGDPTATLSAVSTFCRPTCRYLPYISRDRALQADLPR